ncbi:hypothetical protein QE152_g10166 [Popillia japonica]|uniref:Uncharacterized protein n=1 Tax=Popillia japonica TaxID=7064 RepID=A0AAW1LVV4_POPJA
MNPNRIPRRILQSGEGRKKKKRRAKKKCLEAGMNPNRIPRRILQSGEGRKKKKRRAKKKCLEAVKMDLKNIEVKQWEEKTRDRDKWRKIVETIEHTSIKDNGRRKLETGINGEKLWKLLNTPTIKDQRSHWPARPVALIYV